MTEETDTLPSLGDHLRRVALPVLLLLTIAFGGGLIGDHLASGIIQALSCLVIIWVINDSKLVRLKRPAVWIAGIVCAFVIVCAVQLVPLPADIWASLSGREPIAEAFRLTGAEPASMPISLAPQETLKGILCFLPPAAIFLLTAKSRWRVKSRTFDWAIPALACVSAVLGFAQVLFPGTPYIHPHGMLERGHAAGIMQLVNHNATLLLMAVPFVAVAIGRLMTRYEMGDPDLGSALLAVTLLVILIAGLVATGSVAGYVLAIPVLIFSALILLERGSGIIFVGALCGLVVVLASIVLLIGTSPNLSGIGLTDLSDGPLSRRESFRLTLEAAREHMPTGSGLGTFASLYPSYEDPDLVNENFIINAHNDYLEVLLELGAAGAALTLAGLFWIAWANIAAWRAQQSEGARLRRAAGIAALVVVFHSLTDSPIRTEAIACLFAFCLGILASSPTASEALRPKRNSSGMSHKHIEI